MKGNDILKLEVILEKMGLLNEISQIKERLKSIPTVIVSGGGVDNNNGSNAGTAKEIELRKTSTYIQWRYIGETWFNLIALADLKGDDGSNGQNGLPGTNGINGINGIDGEDGYAPIKGVDYFDGEKGDQGIQGIEGPQGPKGDQGIQGNQGIQGPAGENGTDGADGIGTATSVGALVNSLTEKTTPVDADMIGIMDSAASNIWKKLSWSNIKSKLKTYFDSIYQPVLTPPSITHTGTFVIPLVLRRQDDWNIQNVLLGDNTSKELPNAKGKGVTELYYDENSSSNTDKRLNTLSMDDLAYCGLIYFRNLAGLTSLQFLELIASIGLNMGDLSCYNGIYLNNIPYLTTLTFSELIHSTNLVMMSLGMSGAGVALSFPKLKYVSNIGTGQGSLNMVTCKINGEINFPELESISNFYLQQITGATAVRAAKLKRCISAFSMTTLASITSIDFSLLEDVAGNFSIKAFGSSASPITTLSFPALTKLRGTSPTTFTDDNALALSMPAMVEYTSGVTFAGTNRMSSVVLGTIGTLKKVGGNVLLPMLGSYGLDLTSVNAIIALLASLDGTNGTTAFAGTVTLTGGTTVAPTFNLATQTKAGTAFTGSGTTCTVTWVGHGYSTNDLLTISGITNASYANGTFFITRDTADQFHFTIPNQQSPTTGAGTATVKKANSTTDTYYYKQLILNRGGTVNNVGSN